MKSLLEKNAMEMYSTHSERKIVVVERFIRNLKNRIYKYMTSILKNVYIDKLNNRFRKYNTYNRHIKMKPVDVKSNTYINSGKKLMMKILHLKSKILLKYRNIKK